VSLKCQFPVFLPFPATEVVCIAPRFLLSCLRCSGFSAAVQEKPSEAEGRWEALSVKGGREQEY